MVIMNYYKVYYYDASGGAPMFVNMGLLTASCPNSAKILCDILFGEHISVHKKGPSFQELNCCPFPFQLW